jgi:hypothetical protein
MTKECILIRTNERRTQLTEMCFMRHTAGYLHLELKNDNRITDLWNNGYILRNSRPVRETDENVESRSSDRNTQNI